MSFAVRIGCCVIGALACAAMFAIVSPNARNAVAMLMAQDDPAALSELQLRTTARPKPADIEREIDAALASGDTDLAESLVGLARDLNIPVSSAAVARVESAIAASGTVSHLAGRFASG